MFAFCLFTAAASFDQRTKRDSTHAIEGLINRLLPNSSSFFTFECVEEADEHRDFFELETIHDRLVVRGNNGVSLAYATHFYFKHFAGVHISWGNDRSGNTLDMFLQAHQQGITQWPTVNPRVRREGLPLRIYMNPCTCGYIYGRSIALTPNRTVGRYVLLQVRLPLGNCAQCNAAIYGELLHDCTFLLLWI
jgi:hypothetical protein